MSFSKVFDDATATALEDVRRGRFDLQSEKDIQALVFHYAILLAEKLGLPLKLHAEPTRAEQKPDLVFGDNEVIVELKLSKAATGGYTEAVKKWRGDVEKLRKYKSHWPTARCIFLAVDEANYHSAPSSANYFNPSAENLRGGWKQLGEATRFLLAEL